MVGREEHSILLTLIKVNKKTNKFFSGQRCLRITLPAPKNSRRGEERGRIPWLKIWALGVLPDVDEQIRPASIPMLVRLRIKVLHIDDDDDDDGYYDDDATLDVLHIGEDHGDDYDGDDYNSTCVTEET